ncbi:patatin-like phospholipase family protein [Daejeonella sp.]|uniref:patatin-like phospholipase family protein n=1 Tax=Daejeonella sp. TaxID=2805397 RepID=UPI0030BD19B7
MMKTTYLVIIFSTLFLNGYSQIRNYENIVFEGAGMRGIAYTGVLRQFEKSGISNNIKKVGGTSAGAITALMFSLGYNSDEIYDIISGTKFQKFNDGEFIFFGGFSRLNGKYGWYKGDNFIKWLEKIIKSKTGNSEITFKELQEKGFKQLYVTGTSMNKQKLLIFSSETYPQMKVKDAVRISMSIPLYFEAVFIDSIGRVYKKHRGVENLDVVVDGGIMGNFPIFMFDSIGLDSLNNKIRIPNYKTIGVRIDSDLQIKSDSLDKELVPVQISNISDYLQAFYLIVLENLNRNKLIPEDWERTISVSSAGISPKIRKLTKEEKEALILSGEQHTLEFIKKNK